MKKMFRSTANSRLTGVCGGLAEYLGISATFVRIVAVISALCSFGTTLLVYFIAAMVMPKAPTYYPYH
ncbi:PspC domain-containing protein [Paenibacillus sp. TRM 82003]|nr:PspC domain-containing protein [Paenibacillus sp. TRM 82003]